MRRLGEARVRVVRCRGTFIGCDLASRGCKQRCLAYVTVEACSRPGRVRPGQNQASRLGSLAFIAYSLLSPFCDDIGVYHSHATLTEKNTVEEKSALPDLGEGKMQYSVQAGECANHTMGSGKSRGEPQLMTITPPKNLYIDAARSIRSERKCECEGDLDKTNQD